MLIVALVLAVIGLAALVTAVVTSNELVAWVCIAASVLGVILLIVDAIRERQSRVPAGADAAADSRAQFKVANFVIEQPDEHEEAPVDFSPVVVAEGSKPLRPLSVASAVAELDLTGAPLIVFQHATSERVNIVYRRRDGAIGWLDPH